MAYTILYIATSEDGFIADKRGNTTTQDCNVKFFFTIFFVLSR